MKTCTATTSDATLWLDLLPNELLAHIRSFIEPDDLVAHVCFYQLSERMEVYVDDAENYGYWYTLCARNGIGCLSKYEGRDEDSWKQIAFECAEHAWYCKHPACGRECLEYNADEVRGVEDDLPHLSLGHILTDADREGTYPSELFKHIDFRRTSDSWWPSPVLHFNTPGQNCIGVGTPPCDEGVEAHPIIMRSLATFPAVDRMGLLTFSNLPYVENERGCTIADVLRSMKSMMNECLTMADMEEWIRCVEGPSANIFPATWELEDIFRNVQRVSDLFQVTNWVGLNYVERNEPRMFNFRFRSRLSPPTPDDCPN